MKNAISRGLGRGKSQGKGGIVIDSTPPVSSQHHDVDGSLIVAKSPRDGVDEIPI